MTDAEATAPLRTRFARRLRTTALAAALAAVLGAAPGPMGGSARAESLADVMVEALLNSPDVQAQLAQIKVASETAVQARAQGRINITGNIGLDIDFTDAETATGTSFPTTLSLTVIQPLYTGGQIANQTEAAETRIDVQEVVLDGVEQSVLLDAVTAYADVRRDEVLVDVALNSVEVLREQLRAAEERFEVGEVTRTDVEQARARVAASQSTLAAARGQLAVSRESFTRVVGRPPGDLDPPPPLPQLPDNLEEAIQISLQNQPNLRAARLERVASGSDVRAAIGALLPTVSLEGTALQSKDFNDSSSVFRSSEGTQNATIGLNISIPFYSGGTNYSLVRQAQAQVEVAEADITSAMRNSVQSVGNAWAQLEVARASIDAGVLEVRAAELAFEGINEEAKVGARTTIDVLDAEQDVLDARASLVGARRDEYVSAYNILASIGLLTVEHLGLDLGTETIQSVYYETVRDRNFGYDESDDTVWSLSWRP